MERDTSGSSVKIYVDDEILTQIQWCRGHPTELGKSLFNLLSTDLLLLYLTGKSTLAHRIDI